MSVPPVATGGRPPRAGAPGGGGIRRPPSPGLQRAPVPTTPRTSRCPPGAREEVAVHAAAPVAGSARRTAALVRGKISVGADAAPRVTVERTEHGDPRLGTAFVPADRVSARAFASFEEATVVHRAFGG